MGVINLTPDSFHAASRSEKIDRTLAKVAQMIDEGADIIDFGAASSRPGAVAPSLDEEIERLVPSVMAVRANFPDIRISIDTYRSSVLESCLSIGVDMVNDISAGTLDDDFLPMVGRSGLPYVLMHMRGTPKVMQQDVKYNDLVWEIASFLSERIAVCQSFGIEDIIIDLGFGFGKTIDDNYQLIRELSSFGFLGRPILAGLSRKSMIYKVLGVDADHALNGTSALHMLALINGAKLLRVHDVKEARECIMLYHRYISANN
jgi:dihydropteroate synthase